MNIVSKRKLDSGVCLFKVRKQTQHYIGQRAQCCVSKNRMLFGVWFWLMPTGKIIDLRSQAIFELMDI